MRVEVVLGHLLEADAVDLAGRVERHLLEEEDLLGGLVADLLAAVDDQVSGARPLGALAQGYVGADFLAVDFVVDADRAGEGDGRVLDERARKAVDQHAVLVLVADFRCG